MLLNDTLRGLWLVLLVGLVLGGSGAALAGDREDIVGRWNNPIIGTSYIRFFADGTFTDAALLVTTKGTYRILAGAGVIEIETPGILGPITREVKYKLNGDTLELENPLGGGYVKYTRAR
jgi:hypothetical protein